MILRNGKSKHLFEVDPIPGTFLLIQKESEVVNGALTLANLEDSLQNILPNNNSIKITTVRD
ncbi:hypothetical protein GCM10010978_29820 [Compostibacillus humi]|uniref:Uncharacterized protein n=1 Tax=Compostibacillus humi TaxID=1245525 RepID=A0A8J2TUQ7_9BACI|nr:hypothetical protein GCM10010978_29820 [Compostibacillus humi]